VLPHYLDNRLTDGTGFEKWEASLFVHCLLQSFMFLISSFPKGMIGHKYNGLVNIVTILLLRIKFSKIDVVT
jgi:hypothetical protein